MSTNIHDAFICKKPLHELVPYLVSKRKYYISKSYANFLNAVIKEAISSYDLHQIPHTSPYYEIKDEGFDKFIAKSFEEYDRYAKEDMFQPECRLSIGVYPMKKRTFLTVHGHYDMINEFVENEKDWLVDYSYWDSTDKPDEVTNRQWNKRKKDWDIVFEKYWTRAEAMLTYDYVGDVWEDIPRRYGFLIRRAHIESVVFPSDNVRKKDIFLNDELLKLKNEDFSYSLYHNEYNRLKKEIEEGLHDENINKIQLKPLDGDIVNSYTKIKERT